MARSSIAGWKNPFGLGEGARREGNREAQRGELAGGARKQSTLGSLANEMPLIGPNRANKHVDPKARLSTQFGQMFKALGDNPLWIPFQKAAKYLDRRGQVLDPDPNPFS